MEAEFDRLSYFDKIYHGLHIDTTPYLCRTAASYCLITVLYKVEMKYTLSLAGYAACRKAEDDDFVILPFRCLLANCRLHCAEETFTFPLLVFAQL